MGFILYSICFPFILIITQLIREGIVYLFPFGDLNVRMHQKYILGRFWTQIYSGTISLAPIIN